MKRLLMIGGFVGVVALIVGCASNFTTTEEAATSLKQTGTVELAQPIVNCQQPFRTALSDNLQPPKGYNIVRPYSWWYCYDTQNKDTDVQIAFRFPHNNQSKNFILGNKLLRVGLVTRIWWKGSLGTVVKYDKTYQYVHIVLGKRICWIFHGVCERDIQKIVRNFWIAYK